MGERLTSGERARRAAWRARSVGLAELSSTGRESRLAARPTSDSQPRSGARARRRRRNVTRVALASACKAARSGARAIERRHFSESESGSNFGASVKLQGNATQRDARRGELAASLFARRAACLSSVPDFERERRTCGRGARVAGLRVVRERAARGEARGRARAEQTARAAGSNKVRGSLASSKRFSSPTWQAASCWQARVSCVRACLLAFQCVCVPVCCILQAALFCGPSEARA